MPKFTISILTYTNLEGARACIGSVLVNSSDFELILTANGNAEAGGFFEQLRVLYPGMVRAVYNQTNEGFIEPNKKALEMARGTYLVLLNDDATVPPGWLDMLEEPFKHNPRAAITGAVGGCRTLTPDYHGDLSNHLDYIEGSCMCCKVEVVRKLGLFADYLKFAYCEDSDLCLRVRETGYTIHEAPFSINHHRGGTSSKLPPEAAAQLWRQADANRAACKERWAYYLKTRRFCEGIIVKRAAAWGDVLLTTPIIRALKAANPAREIFVETPLNEIFERNPDVARAASSIDEPDCRIIDLNMAYERRPGVHIIDAYAEVVPEVGKLARVTTLHPDPNDLKVAAAVFSARKWVAIHPGPGTWIGKNWSPENWTPVVEWLRLNGFAVVLVGHPSGGLYEHIPCDKDRRGKTSVSKLAAILYHCEFFIGIDSFCLHVAQAVKTPVVGLFGVTSPQFILTDGSLASGVIGNGPMTGARHKVSDSVCVDSDGAEMRDISPNRVFAAVERLRGAMEKEFQTL